MPNACAAFFAGIIQRRMLDLMDAWLYWTSLRCTLSPLLARTRRCMAEFLQQAMALEAAREPGIDGSASRSRHRWMISGPSIAKRLSAFRRIFWGQWF